MTTGVLELRGRDQFGLPMLAVVRAAARELSQVVPEGADLGEVCLHLGSFDTKAVDVLRLRLSSLAASERNYWIGTLYTLMISADLRRAQATYFTRPDLAEAVIDLAIEHGFDLREHSVLDPAAGGAAFLSLIAHRMRAEKLDPADIASRLNGVEIDVSLATMSESLIAEQLEGYAGRRIVSPGDSLRHEFAKSYDLVIANPPYGRITAKDLENDHWMKVAHSGHINKYAVFTELCFRLTKPGGLVALVIPSSFKGGPLYDRMRSFIANRGQILALGTVVSREDVFADVTQDISVLLVRVGGSHPPSAAVKFPSFIAGGIARPVPAGILPGDVSMPWLAPWDSRRDRGGATIADYGGHVKAGYFVWNRSQEKFCASTDPGALPLFWAKNIRAGTPCKPRNRKNDGTDFVTVPKDSPAIISGPAIMVQRTTNSSQSRRIVAAVVDQNSIAGWPGFVSENHTIVITGDRADDLALLASLLNTKAVDERYRAVSGTATVSVKLLRELDLPWPQSFRDALLNGFDAEEAAVLAYRNGERRPLAEAS
ncbi:Eco57I restriction-modification methylase domain-containing protein [Ensifer adhaerens]|uniref:Eco57I restriction-modification methylase domain-containing protein n=1 Tax=Ensifer adhaerens TaxID=106592 RepID=UPI001CBC04DE|nr:N-6 DNA methylase [Ensifer adhaerens]MBZ7925009.1 SAM-dependent methyltransferase [Ensifer adhaerens]